MRMARIVEESYIADLCEWIIVCEREYELDKSRAVAEIRADLENMPKLVRCKDCKRWEYDAKKMAGLCERHINYTAEWDFCSYGERKGNEGQDH
jgi:hypothetical protein